MRRWAIHTALLTQIACSSAHDADGAGASDGLDTGEADTADEDVDSGEGGSPTWWRLGASFAVALDGSVAGSGAALTVSVEDEAALPLCVESVPVAGLEDAVKTPDPMVYTWWEVTPTALVGDCNRLDPLQEAPVLLGVGALHPEIRAALGSAGLAAAADALNGAYVSLNGGQSVYVYGVAGPAEAFEGVGTAAEAAPLPVGDWEIRPLYAFVYTAR